jgi:feruloyl-CoA synthase
LSTSAQRDATFAPPRIETERRPGGRLLIRSAEPLGEHPISVVHSFRAHSEAHPDRLLIAERGPDGEWARASWGEVRVQADRLAQGLLDRGLVGRPVMVLSGASRLHLTVTLAAMTVGAPVVPASVAYSLQSADHAKLRALADLADPGLVVAEDTSFARAAEAVGGGRVVLGPAGQLSQEDLGADPTAEVDRRCAALRPDDIAKIMFTSGSTGSPKGVLNTHGMLAANLWGSITGSGLGRQPGWDHR